jgi:hypothetical protein
MPKQKAHELESGIALEMAALLRNEGWAVQKIFEDESQWRCDVVSAEIEGGKLRIRCEDLGRTCNEYEVSFAPGSFATVTIYGEHCWHKLRFLWIEEGSPRALVVTNEALAKLDQKKTIARAAIDLHRMTTDAGHQSEIEA